MPIWEYRCGACQHVTSVLVRSVTATPKPKCEQCGSRRMSRQLSTFMIPQLDPNAEPPDREREDGPKAGDPAYARWLTDRIDKMGVDLSSEARERIRTAGQPAPDAGPGAPPAPAP